MTTTSDPHGPPTRPSHEVARATCVAPAPAATRALGIATIVTMGWLSRSGSASHRPIATRKTPCASSTCTCRRSGSRTSRSSSRRSARRLYLFTKKHSLGFDRFAGASAEIGVVFMALTLVSGMLWGRITWGVYWQWDARLTTTALLFVIVRSATSRCAGSAAATTSAPSAAPIIGLLAVLEIPLVHCRSSCGAACTRSSSLDRRAT